jgi:hypothetical protein
MAYLGRVVTTRNLGSNARGTDALFPHVLILLAGWEPALPKRPRQVLRT